MKHILPLILAIVLLTTACSDQRYVAMLNHAEALMDSLPDTSLALLDSVNSSRLVGADNARYALLRSQALDKNYIDVTNDSLINIAVDYYAHSGNDHYKMLAYYYHARVKYNAGDFAQSIVSLLKAESVATDLDDYYWIGRTCEQIANIYDINNHHTEAVMYAIRSYENLCHAQKQPYINYSLLRLSRMYLNSDEYENSIQVAQQVLDSAFIYNDSYLENRALRILAKSHYGNCDYTTSIETISQIESINNLSNDLLCILGICFFETNDIDNAGKIYDKIKADSTNIPKHLLYKLYHKNNDISNAIVTLESLYCELEDVLESSLSQNFATTISLYYKKENALVEEELQKTKFSRFFIIAFFALLITLFIIRYRKQQEKLNKNLIIAQNLQDIINFKNNNLEEANKTIKELINTKFDIINNLCVKYFENKTSLKAKKLISDEVDNLIKELSSNKQIKELELQVDKYLDNIVHDLKNDLPHLKPQDYNLFLYSILGFSTTAITLLLGEEKNDAVYNRKARLKNKIKLLESNKQGRYLPFLN